MGTRRASVGQDDNLPEGGRAEKALNPRGVYHVGQIAADRRGRPAAGAYEPTIRVTAFRPSFSRSWRRSETSSATSLTRRRPSLTRSWTYSPASSIIRRP